jgi:hypothetical protein
MQNFDANIGALVAADSQGTIKALDEAILSELKMCTTLVEAIQGQQLPIGSSQKLLNSMASGIHNIVAGRNDMAATVRYLTVLKQDSNLAVYDFGCPNASHSQVGEPHQDRVAA